MINIYINTETTYYNFNDTDKTQEYYTFRQNRATGSTIG